MSSTIPAYDEHTGSIKLVQDFQVINDLTDPGGSIEEALNRSASSSTTPPKSHPLLDKFSKFTQLNMIDCFLEVTLDTSPVEQNFPCMVLTKTRYLASRQVHGTIEENRLARPVRLRAAVREAALALAHWIPTLQSGCFWAWERVGEQDEHYYRRWSWFIDQAEDGSSHVRLDPFTERFPAEFLANTDGTRLEHYEPHTEG
ncbi:hypothetical protein I204_01356 [Kwoniella mangroviensis CBS 8886]|uniref:uncharacterized protein n=1 Tax=Kwoniella mangroviensis CBS 8507 TaxID=1296122 RepID=UPI00080CD897|nr:uncharacterized protein I203_06078 [Kwoniella mangroviensis CBS 8507]OCF64834.1 hypothetical protein I203_06078 [Kwoniella mangroviensis CBS 8507]OCF77368.1 hypothetical protein I204_01356 [Kwoniella mangroviensis CBS 8886]